MRWNAAIAIAIIVRALGPLELEQRPGRHVFHRVCLLPRDSPYAGRADPRHQCGVFGRVRGVA